MDETIESAMNRIIAAKKIEAGDYYCALEGGVGKDQYGAFLTGYVCVVDKNSKIGVGGGYRMPIPDVIYEWLETGKYKELGEIMDKLVGEHNTKQKGGAVSVFTENKLVRKEIFRISTIFALVPFVSKKFSETIKEK